LELYEKVLVEDEFLESDHGDIACVDCHGGNPEDNNWETAHKGLVKDPTFPDASKACGDCHEDIVETAKSSLHVTLLPYRLIIGKRATQDPSVKKALEKAMGKHCMECHSSCGQCHVSRPDSVEGGLVQGHKFMKTPPMGTNCTSCHGSRLEKEFTGKNPGIPGDVHFVKENMECVSCHKAGEMHGDGNRYPTMHEVMSGPKCVDCHKDAGSATSKKKVHRLHHETVKCTVCHSLQYKNCYGCHVGTDEKGLPYFQTDQTVMDFKIGLNPKITEEQPYKFVTVRHVPTNPGLFDFYVKGGLKNFDQVPTWKPATPHNIQLKTPQNKSCRSCHKKKKLFLTEKDVKPEERAANRSVIVPKSAIPTKTKKK